MILSPQVAGQGPQQTCAGDTLSTGGGLLTEFEEVLE
jgi:hypothetical protein